MFKIKYIVIALIALFYYKKKSSCGCETPKTPCSCDSSNDDNSKEIIRTSPLKEDERRVIELDKDYSNYPILTTPIYPSKDLKDYEKFERYYDEQLKTR